MQSKIHTINWLISALNVISFRIYSFVDSYNYTTFTFTFSHVQSNELYLLVSHSVYVLARPVQGLVICLRQFLNLIVSIIINLRRQYFDCL